MDDQHHHHSDTSLSHAQSASDMPKTALAQRQPSLWGRVLDSLHSFWMRKLSTPSIHRKLVHGVMTRGAARREAKALYDIVAGFSYAQTLRAVIALDLLPLLAAKPHSLGSLGTITSLSEDSIATLMDSSTALRLTRRRHDGLYTIDTLGAAIIADPGIATMVRHHDLMYKDMADPVALLRNPMQSQMAAFWAYTDDDQTPKIDSTLAAPYSEVMAASQKTVVDLILSAVDFKDTRRLLDIGCGSGGFANALLGRYPELKTTLLDLPPVIKMAKTTLSATPDSFNRCQFFGADFMTLHGDALPGAPFDQVCLIRVIHDQDDARAEALFKLAFEALEPGGRLIVAETMADHRSGEIIGRVYFQWFLHAMGRGRTRTRDAFEALAKSAGFAPGTEHKSALPMIARVIAFRKPA